ncbi:MAG: hypothetical protein HY293_00755 [Planctomycetes bacterium]|nr:hypothetical protein [Planctomycetota bacterium]
MGLRRCPTCVGKEITYCHSCGHRLVGDGSERSVHDNRRYCRTCCPSQPVPTALEPKRRASSTRLKSPAPKPRETTRIRKRRPLRLIASAAAVAAMGIGIALAAGGRPAPLPLAKPSAVAPELPPPPAPAPPPPVEELLVRIREIRHSDLMFERRDEVVRLLKEAAGRAGPRLEEVDVLSADYERKYEQAAARLADFTRSEAMRMAARQKYAEAFERLDGYPAAFRGSKAAEQVRLCRLDLERRRAESALQPASQTPRRVISWPEWRRPA